MYSWCKFESLRGYFRFLCTFFFWLVFIIVFFTLWLDCWPFTALREFCAIAYFFSLILHRGRWQTYEIMIPPPPLQEMLRRIMTHAGFQRKKRQKKRGNWHTFQQNRCRLYLEGRHLLLHNRKKVFLQKRERPLPLDTCADWPTRRHACGTIMCNVKCNNLSTVQVYLYHYGVGQ